MYEVPSLFGDSLLLLVYLVVYSNNQVGNDLRPGFIDTPCTCARETKDERQTYVCGCASCDAPPFAIRAQNSVFTRPDVGADMNALPEGKGSKRAPGMI